MKFSGKNGKHAAARCAFLMSVESGKMLKQDESVRSECEREDGYGDLDALKLMHVLLRGGYFAGTVLFNSKEFNFRVSTRLRIRLKNSAYDLR